MTYEQFDRACMAIDEYERQMGSAQQGGES